MPKLHDKIFCVIIWRQNRLAMNCVDQNKNTIDQGLYRGAIQLLHHAVKYRNYSFARSLLKRGVDIDCLDGFPQTALQDAAQRGHLGGMKWLLKKGCDINAVREKDGQNALSHCYEYCDRDTRDKTADFLRRYGAEFPPDYVPNADDESDA